MLRKNKKLIFLLIILVIASFFRLWQLDEIPPGPYPDVAMNGNDALETLRTGNFRVFYPDNFGREGLFIWLLAFSFSIFGISIWSLKIVAATIGILTVLGLYLLTKELFSKSAEVGPPQIALLSSFFLAISFWHVNFSRIGFRAILLPFTLVFSFYFFFRGCRTRKIWNFIVSGIFFGLGFYTYTSFRFAPLIILLLFFLFWLIYRKGGFKKRFKFHLYVIYFILGAFVVALPIGTYFLTHPQDFIGRAGPILVFAAENPLKEFGKSLILHLAMFNFYGDPNWRHNFSGLPQLFWPIGILFLIGLFYSFSKFVKSLLLRSSELSVVFGFLICWWFIMLLPGILTYEGIPHALRVIGVIPVVYIFTGLGAWKFYEFLKKNTSRKKLLIFVSFFFLFALAVFEFNKYFVIWAKHPKVEEAFTTGYSDIGYYLNSLAPEIQKYVIVNEPGHPLYGISIPGQTPMFIESTKFGKPRATYLKFEDLDQIKVNQEKTIIIPLYDGKTFDELSKRFPQGEIKEEKMFQFYEIE